MKRYMRPALRHVIFPSKYFSKHVAAKQMLPRPPVVTIMGHVDHGKTTLLDTLRRTRVAASEAGGITQHIGAFSFNLPCSAQRITFLDTPGHAAFTAIRSRGAKATDIVVLVVAADDGPMPQTIESIKMAQAADTPIIVAINKCDKFMQRVEKVKEELLKYDVILEDFGGPTQAVCISALTGEGLASLEQAILAQAEIMDLTANHDGPVKAIVIESRMQPEIGEIATLLIKDGILHIGDIIVADEAFCRVRQLTDHTRRRLQEADPSTPVEVLGWKGVPTVGSVAEQALDEKTAKGLIDQRERVRVMRGTRDGAKEASERAKLDTKLLEMAKTVDPTKAPKKILEYDFVLPKSDTPILPLLIKCDAHGSEEAILKAIQDIPKKKAMAMIVASGVGPLSLHDVDIAHHAKAKVVLFSQTSTKPILKEASLKGITILSYQIIYHLVDEVRKMLTELIPTAYREDVQGMATVLQVFSVDNSRRIIAGCRVDDGIVNRSADPLCFVRVMRKGSLLHEGVIKNMRHGKKDMNTVGKGMECGIQMGKFEAFLPDDQILYIKRVALPKSIE